MIPGWFLAESAVPVEFHFLQAGKMRAGEEEKCQHACCLYFSSPSEKPCCLVSDKSQGQSQCDLKRGMNNLSNLSWKVSQRSA